MDADSEYRRFQFGIADLLAIMLFVAVLGSFSALPVSVLHSIPLLAVLYLAKFRILRLRVRPWVASLVYCLVVVALLPYLYYRVTGDEYKRFRPTCPSDWILGPIELFSIPTASFLYDVLAHKRPSLESYATRSLLEIVILIPLWAFFWGWFTFGGFPPG